MGGWRSLKKTRGFPALKKHHQKREERGADSNRGDRAKEEMGGEGENPISEVNADSNGNHRVQKKGAKERRWGGQVCDGGGERTRDGFFSSESTKGGGLG